MRGTSGKGRHPTELGAADDLKDTVPEAQLVKWG